MNGPYRVVRAADVRVGDRIWGGPHVGWWSVLAIEVMETGYVRIETAGWSTWKHPDEGVAVQPGQGADSA